MDALLFHTDMILITHYGIYYNPCSRPHLVGKKGFVWLVVIALVLYVVVAMETYGFHYLIYVWLIGN